MSDLLNSLLYKMILLRISKGYGFSLYFDENKEKLLMVIADLITFAN